MREIKFRAWHKVRKEYFDITHVENDSNSESDISVLEQYSGVKDKNGRRIYEGDILKMYRHSDNTHKHEVAQTWINGKYVDNIKEVKFIFGSFVIWSDLIREYRNFSTLARPGESYEIIGNVNQNPELLTTQLKTTDKF